MLIIEREKKVQMQTGKGVVRVDAFGWAGSITESEEW